MILPANEVMVTPKNEGKACDAVVTFLERRTGQKRTNIRRSEIDGIGPRVDLRLSLGSQDYAIEHTQIETFSRQIQMQKEFGDFITPVVDQLSGTLPAPGVYHLYFPTNARIGVPPNKLDNVRSDFTDWVREHSQRLHAKNPDRPTRKHNPHGFDGQYRAKPPGFPYEVMLRREAHWSFSSRHDGVLLVARIAPEHVETRRAARLKEALDGKCPKLRRCKEEGSHTILVLEDSDVSLSNYALIGDGLADALKERRDLPDEIYLLETAIDPWTLRCVKDANDGSPIEEWTEFYAGDLRNITSKLD